MANHDKAPHIDSVRDNNGKYIVPFILLMLVLWATGVYNWMRSRDLGALLLLGYLGLFFGVGVGGYVALPNRFRPYARKVVMFLAGTLLLVLALVTDHGNMQIEGLFFALLTGVAPFVIIHYFVAKLAGPLVLGRVWCGWACWYGMIFDMLPYPFSHYRRARRLSLLRYLHFAASIGIVLMLWFIVGFESSTGNAGLYWFIFGLFIYYGVGIVLALALKDNRAFCKYICPISVPMKEISRFSLIKMDGTAECCPENCESCVEMCPMNIRVKDYLMANRRVLSTECVMCLTCLNVCPTDSIRPSFGFDIGGKEIWDHDPTRGNKETVPNIAWIEKGDEPDEVRES